MHLQKENRLKVLLTALLVVFLVALYLLSEKTVMRQEEKYPEQTEKTETTTHPTENVSEKVAEASRILYVIGVIEKIDSEEIIVRGVEKQEGEFSEKSVALPSKEDAQKTVTGTMTKDTLFAVPVTVTDNTTLLAFKREGVTFKRGDAVWFIVMKMDRDGVEKYEVKSVSPILVKDKK